MMSRNNRQMIAAATATALTSHVGLGQMLARGFRFDEQGTGAPAGQPPGGGNARTVEQLRQEFATLQGEAGQVIDGAIAGNRDLSEAEQAENNRRFARMNTIRTLIDQRARFAGLALAGDPEARGTATRGNAEPPGRREFEQSEANGGGAETVYRDGFAARAGESEDRTRQRQRDAINRYLFTGERSRDLRFTVTTGTSGVVLPRRSGPVVVVKRQRNPIRAALLARGFRPLETPDLIALTLPVFDDTANTADAIAETSTSENNKDPAVSDLPIGATLRDSGTLWMSNTLLGSLDYDLLAYVEPMLDARIEAAEIASWRTALIAATVGVTTVATNGVTCAELVRWQHSIAPMRRADSVFIVSDGLLLALRTLVDTTGRPIFQESMRDDAPDRLLGWPIFVDEGLATPAAGAVSGVAVDVSSVVVRDATGRYGRRLARYVDVPTQPDKFGLREFANNGFAFHAAGVRTLKHAAS